MTSVATASPERVGIVDSFAAQARLRMTVGLPVIILGSLLLWYGGNTDRNAIALIGSLHVSYVVLAYALSYRLHPRFASPCSTATAIFDPLLLTAWLPWMGEHGVLVVCFYLFTTLGYGFRVDARSMMVCQLTSLAGLTLTIAITPFWQQHYLIWWSCAVSLVVVPLYASVLIKQLQ